MRSFRRILITIPVSIMVATLTGCYYDDAELLYGGARGVDCTTISSKTFKNDVYPIIVGKCAISDCHDDTGSGQVVLKNYTQIAARSTRIYQRCVVEQTMPPTRVLSPHETAIIKCWIDSGSPNN